MAGLEKVRWGVIGATARIAGSAVIPAICGSEYAELAAVASRSLASAKDVAADCDGDVAAYGDYDSLIADDAVEAVYIPLPNNLHLGWAVEAMNNGKHVLCEKPLALNADEAAEMVETAERNGVLLSEAFMYRYHPLQREVFDLVARGTLGPVRSVRATFSFVQVSPEDYRRDPSMGGGALLDVGCYGIHIARQVFGHEPVTVTGQWTLDPLSGIDTHTTAQMEFAGGGIAQIECAFAAQFSASYEIVGADGSVTATKFFGENRTDDASYTLIVGDHPPQVKSVPYGSMYEGEIEAMSRRIRGEDCFLLPAQDGYYNMRVLDAIALSARSGETVALSAP